MANALRHSGCDEDDLLRVEAELMGRDLMISVHCLRMLPSQGAPIPQDAADPSYLNATIIQGMAQDWGVERDDGYQVWAVLGAGG